MTDPEAPSDLAVAALLTDELRAAVPLVRDRHPSAVTRRPPPLASPAVWPPSTSTSWSPLGCSGPDPRRPWVDHRKLGAVPRSMSPPTWNWRSPSPNATTSWSASSWSTPSTRQPPTSRRSPPPPGSPRPGARSSVLVTARGERSGGWDPNGPSRLPARCSSGTAMNRSVGVPTPCGCGTARSIAWLAAPLMLSARSTRPCFRVCCEASATSASRLCLLPGRAPVASSSARRAAPLNRPTDLQRHTTILGLGFWVLCSRTAFCAFSDGLSPPSCPPG